MQRASTVGLCLMIALGPVACGASCEPILDAGDGAPTLDVDNCSRCADAGGPRRIDRGSPGRCRDCRPRPGDDLDDAGAPPRDAGVPDLDGGPRPDGGAADAGAPEAGVPDAGSSFDGGAPPAGTCDDGVRGGSESDVDCGGSCAPCAAGATCALSSDCDSDICSGGVCQPAVCQDDDGDGICNEVDSCNGTNCQPPACDGHPTRYPFGRRHSPLTCEVARRLRQIAQHDAGARTDVFIKVGDSITAGSDFLACFATEDVDLIGTGNASLQGAMTHFLGGDVAGQTPFERDSLAAQAGAAASWVISGSPSPLERELAAAHPRYAVVMYGTNDLWQGGGPDPVDAKYLSYYESMSTLLDELAARGVVPILSTIPPHNGDPPWFHDLVPTLNAVVVGLAQARQIPVMDYYGALAPVPGNGLSDDGIHPNSHDRRCDFSSAGLRHGYNVRNLLTLEALDRTWQVVSGARDVWDDGGAPPLAGEGSTSAPYVVTALPFVAALDTSAAGPSALSTYPGCGAAAALTGRELVYRVDVASPVRMRALALHRGSVDTDLRLLYGAPSGAACRAAGDDILQGTLSPGTWYFVVDSRDSALEGASLFVLVACEPGDARCEAPL